MRGLLLVLVVACSDPAAQPDAGIDAAPDAGASVTITPAAYYFGEWDLAYETDEPEATFAVRNVSGASVDITSVAIAGSAPDDFEILDNACPTTLAPDAACLVRVQFDPIARDVREAALEVTAGAVVRASLQGTALVGPTKLIFMPSAKNFGDLEVGTGSESFTFTVLNEAVASTFAVAIVGPDAAAYEVDSTTCNATVPLHGTCTVAVSMTPPHAGEHAAQVRLTSATNETGAAGLLAHSSTPLAISPYAETTGSMLVGQPETPGQAVFTIENTTLTTSGTLATTLAGAAASEFAIVANTCTTLAPAATCQVTVRLAATTRGFKAAQLVVTDQTSSIAARANISGSAYTALISTTGAFADTASGQTTTRTFNVVNASNRATSAITTNITGADFSIVGNTCAAGIAANGNCQIMVRFAPTSTGAKTGNLSVSASIGGSDDVVLTGQGV